MVRIDAEDLRPALASRVLEAALNVLEGEVDLGVDLLFKFSRLGVETAYLPRALARPRSERGIWAGGHALACAFDAVADADGLVVVEFLPLPGAEGLVGVVLEVGHCRYLLGCGFKTIIRRPAIVYKPGTCHKIMRR